MRRYAVLVGLGDYYENTEYSPLKFVLKNVTDFMRTLTDRNWIVSPPLIDQIANRDNILAKLNEIAHLAQAGDTVLFYFTGHGDRIFNQAQQSFDCLLVSALNSPLPRSQYQLSYFLNDINYETIINQFSNGSRHLITIIDCCYAYGMIQGYNKQQEFHSVIAATSENALSYYDSNSLFFKALSRSWNAADFISMGTRIQMEMEELGAPHQPRIYIADKYNTQSLL